MREALLLINRSIVNGGEIACDPKATQVQVLLKDVKVEYHSNK